ncbi:DUF3494 domain-containing protein [Candidatus Gracilibacteria bacterium]|nr:DUF3494 domain-containing protein [Candidatus Gracilibacteria bacterium]
MSLYTHTTAFAATTPSPGTTATYGILSSTYTNTAAGATVNGDIGFTTAPAVVPAGIHTNYGSAAPYATAGIDQGSLLSGLNSQPCTYIFPPGAIDLATDVGHGAIGIYTPGIYCATGAVTIGTPAGIVLNGAGTYIFRINGALNTVANSSVTLSGASSCDVFWTPTAATTLGANSTFFGTVIDDAGITIGSTVTWGGKALAFGGTVTTAPGTNITTPICGVTQATLHVIKQVVNTGGGIAVPSDFMLHVKNTGSGVDLFASGTSFPGTSYSLTGATYVISEDINSSYSPTFSGDCSSTGSVTLLPNQDKTCIITNTYIPPPPPITSGPGGGSVSDNCPTGDYSGNYNDGKCDITTVVINTGTTIDTVKPVVPIVNHTGTVIYTPVFESPFIPIPIPIVPLFPNTGIAPKEENPQGNVILLISSILFIFSVCIIIQKKYIS